MTTVLQTSYRPQIAPAVEGMPVDIGGYEDISRIVETAAGVTFGKAVSQGAADRGCILGGANFIGISLRDVTLGLAPVNPLLDVGPALDTYGQLTNASIRTRGRVWVKAGAVVSAGQALFYDTTSGAFSNSASGQAAAGYIDFTSNPVATNTLVINGTTWTFVASGATGTQVNIGPTLGDTLARLATALNASADTNTVLLTYLAYPPSPGGAAQGSGATRLMMAAKAVGVAGNAYTITTGTTPGTTRSGATLSGGTAAATAVTGARWATSAIAGDLAQASLGIQF